MADWERELLAMANDTCQAPAGAADEISNLSPGAIEMLGELVFADLRARGYDIVGVAAPVPTAQDVSATVGDPVGWFAGLIAAPVRSKLAKRKRKADKRHAFAR